MLALVIEMLPAQLLELLKVAFCYINDKLEDMDVSLFFFPLPEVGCDFQKVTVTQQVGQFKIK